MGYLKRPRLCLVSKGYYSKTDYITMPLFLQIHYLWSASPKSASIKCMYLKMSQCKNYNPGMMKMPLFIYLFIWFCFVFKFSYRHFRGEVRYKLTPLWSQGHLYLALQSLLLIPLIFTFKYYFVLLLKCSVSTKY